MQRPFYEYKVEDERNIVTISETYIFFSAELKMDMSVSTDRSKMKMFLVSNTKYSYAPCTVPDIHGQPETGIEDFIRAIGFPYPKI